MMQCLFLWSERHEYINLITGSLLGVLVLLWGKKAVHDLGELPVVHIGVVNTQ